MSLSPSFFFFFFFNDTATTEIYTLSLHDALPISRRVSGVHGAWRSLDGLSFCGFCFDTFSGSDRKSTRLNSSHLVISYAVFCLKKKKKQKSRVCECSSVVMCFCMLCLTSWYCECE